jgi:hypothetical protein
MLNAQSASMLLAVGASSPRWEQPDWRQLLHRPRFAPPQLNAGDFAHRCHLQCEQPVLQSLAPRHRRTQCRHVLSFRLTPQIRQRKRRQHCVRLDLRAKSTQSQKLGVVRNVAGAAPVSSGRRSIWYCRSMQSSPAKVCKCRPLIQPPACRPWS